MVLLNVKMVICQFYLEEEVAGFFEFGNKSDEYNALTIDLTISHENILKGSCAELK